MTKFQRKLNPNETSKKNPSQLIATEVELGQGIR